MWSCRVRLQEGYAVRGNDKAAGMGPEGVCRMGPLQERLKEMRDWWIMRGLSLLHRY